jgi:hypothetical protein
MLDRGLTEDGAAQALGWPNQRVTARVKLLELPERAQQLIGEAVIGLSAVDQLRAIGIGPLALPVRPWQRGRTLPNFASCHRAGSRGRSARSASLPAASWPSAAYPETAPFVAEQKSRPALLFVVQGERELVDESRARNHADSEAASMPHRPHPRKQQLSQPEPLIDSPLVARPLRLAQ